MFSIKYMMNYFLLLHIFQTTSVSARWGQPWLIQPQSLRKQVSNWMLLYAMFLQLKGWNLKKNLVFWIFLVIVFSFMDSHKDMNVNKFRKPITKHFFKWGKCETFKGINFVVYWWRMQKKGARKQSGADANLLFPNFQPCLPNFQCFQSCVSWTPFCIFSCYFSFAVVWGTYPWVTVS